MTTLIRLVLLAVAALALMGAGVVTVSTETGRGTTTELHCTTIDWQTNASGEANASIGAIRGRIVRLLITPDEASPAEDGHDITILDRDGRDIIQGLGANLSSDEIVSAAWPVSGEETTGAVTFSVTGADATGEGRVRVFFRP